MIFKENSKLSHEQIIKMAEQLRAKLVIKTVRELQSIKRNSKMMQSAEDGILINLWDEICVQVQGEKSIAWSSYEDFIHTTIYDLLEKRYTMKEYFMLWFLTNEFEECANNCESEDNDFNANTLPPIDMQDVVDLIFGEVISSAADYSNTRTEKYLLPCD